MDLDLNADAPKCSELTEGQEQTDSVRTQEKKDPVDGYLLRVQELQEETTTCRVHGAAAEHAELGTGSSATSQLRSCQPSAESVSSAKARREVLNEARVETRARSRAEP